MVTFSMTFADPYPGFQGHEGYEVEYLMDNGHNSNSTLI